MITSCCALIQTHVANASYDGYKGLSSYNGQRAYSYVSEGTAGN